MLSRCKFLWGVNCQFSASSEAHWIFSWKVLRERATRFGIIFSSQKVLVWFGCWCYGGAPPTVFQKGFPWSHWKAAWGSIAIQIVSSHHLIIAAWKSRQIFVLLLLQLDRWRIQNLLTNFSPSLVTCIFTDFLASRIIATNGLQQRPNKATWESFFPIYAGGVVKFDPNDDD